MCIRDRTRPSSLGAHSSRRRPRRRTNTTVAAASGSPATDPSQHLIRIGNGPPTAACRIESTSVAAPDDLGLLVWDSRPRAALFDIGTSSPQREPEASSASKLRCRRRRPGFRKGMASLLRTAKLRTSDSFASESLSHPLRRIVRSCAVGLVGTLEALSLLFAGPGAQVRLLRCRRKRLETVDCPLLHVVVGDALAHCLHLAPSFVLGGGDRAH